MSEPLIGYRSWNFDTRRGRDPRLGSLTGRGDWCHFGLTQAACECIRSNLGPHESPLRDCTCGLHALGIPTFDRSHGLIKGAVAAEGKILIHGNEQPPGFRAQRAIPVAFLGGDLEGSCGSEGRYESQLITWLRQIADRLGVPIVPDLRSLMRVALEHGVSLNEHLEEEPGWPPNPPFEKGIRMHFYHSDLEGAQQDGNYERIPIATDDPRGNLLGSLCYDHYHRPALDVDEMEPDKAIRILNRIWCQMGLDANGAVPQVIPSSTPGHHHLYIDTPLTWRQYRWLLERLAVAGVIEVNYYLAAVAHKGTYLRKPGLYKPWVQRV